MLWIIKLTKFIIITRMGRYRIAQNFGKIKLWRIGTFRILARKTLANTQIGHGNFGKIQ